MDHDQCGDGLASEAAASKALARSSASPARIERNPSKVDLRIPTEDKEVNMFNLIGGLVVYGFALLGAYTSMRWWMKR